MSSTVSSDLISHENVYAWMGTAGKSVSTLTRDGIEVRRNCDTNPGFEVDTSGWSSSGVTTTTYAWTGTANASTSTQSVGGAVKRTNYAHDGVRSALGTATLLADQVFDGRTWKAFTATTTGNAIRWNLNGYGIASGTRVSSAVLVANPSTASILVESDIGDSTSVNIALGPGEQRVLTASGTPTADGIYQFLDLSTATPGATVLFREVIVETGVSATGTYFDGSTASTTQGVDVLRSTAVSHSGSASLQVRWQSPKAQASFAAHSVTGLQDDTDYMVSLWVSIPKALSKPILLSVTDSGTQGPNAVTLQAATPGWQRIVFQYRTLVGSTGLSIWLYDPNAYTGSYLAQSVYIDDVLIETGSAELPYFDGATPSYVEFENTQPLVVNGWEESAAGRNIVNPIIGGDVDVTLQQASLRRGTFELVYQDEDEAAYAFAMHQRPSTFTISDTDRASTSMTYVVDGQISRALDEETRDYWIVRVEYQEV